MARPEATDPLNAIPVFYDDRMVADAESFSPSAGKPRDVVASWKVAGIPLDIRAPAPVTRDQFCLAHQPDMVDDILAGRRANGFGNKSKSVAQSLSYTSGAMLDAAMAALDNGRVAVAPCSGFHHAGYKQCGGYCTFNGLIVTAQALKKSGHVSRVGILDFDMHYGNGTDDCIKWLGLTWIEHYTAGAVHRRPDQAGAFLKSIPKLMESMADCDVILYQAGADPHVDDPLGGWLDDEQLAERDRLVFTSAAKLNIPVAWNLAGGYQEPLRRVLDIHDRTLLACWAVYGAKPTAAAQPAGG